MEDKYAIDITVPKNPLKCHNLLMDVIKGKTEVTKEFALEFLQSTNNRKNIADFIEILDKHIEASPAEYATFKPFLMGILCNREQPACIKETIAQIALKYTSLNNADKTDRDFFSILNKSNLSPDIATCIHSFHTKLCELMPVGFSDISEEVTQAIIRNKQNHIQISQFIIDELPERKKSKKLLKRFYKGRRGR